VNAFAYANERYLVALVLLTRLQDDDIRYRLGLILTRQLCNGLLPYLHRYRSKVHEANEKMSTGNGESLELYSRLIAQLVGRMPTSRLQSR
jgi:hypothetical protein